MSEREVNPIFQDYSKEKEKMKRVMRKKKELGKRKNL